MRTLRSLSRREREMMDIVYGSGRASATEVRARMSDPPSYSAVRATLRILEQKGLLRHDDDAGRYIYRPTLPREKARAGALAHVVETFFAGSTEEAVMALLERPGLELSNEEFHRMAALIERARREGR